MGMVSRFMGRDLVPFITAQKTWAIDLPTVAHFLLDKDLLSYIHGIKKGSIMKRISNFPFGKQEYPRPVETWAYINPITGRKKKSKKRRKKLKIKKKKIGFIYYANPTFLGSQTL